MGRLEFADLQQHLGAQHLRRSFLACTLNDLRQHDADVGFMLAATQGWTPYFGGHSGRAPPGDELLAALSVRRPWGSGSR